MSYDQNSDVRQVEGIDTSVLPAPVEAQQVPETADMSSKVDLTSLKQELATEVSNETLSRASVNGMRENILAALNQGTPEDELKNYLVNNKRMTVDDADMAIVDSVRSKVLEATAAGYSQSEVHQFMSSKFSPDLVGKAIVSANANIIDSKLDYRPDLSEAERAQEISDLYRNIYTKYSTLGNQVRGVFDENKAIEARRDINKLNYAVKQRLVKDGVYAFLDPSTGEVLMRDKDGNVSQVDSSFLSNMYNSKAEITGAIAGAFTGARLGAAAGAPFGPYGVAVGGFAGMVTGGAAGSSLGRGADLVMNASKLSEDLSANLVLTQMKEAGIFDATVSVLGAGVFKLGASSYRGIMRAYKFASHGNPEGALKALKDNLNISDDQAADLVKSWDRLNTPATMDPSTAKAMAGLTPAEKAIAIIQSTHQGAETSVKSAAFINERVATVVRQSVDERAKGLTRAVDSITSDNVGSFVRNDLTAYQDDVKSFFDLVKRQGIDAVNGTDFKFDLDKLAIQPVLKNIETRLSNPVLKERFVGYATRIESATADRSFSGLLELRSAVNDFKYSRTINGPDLDAINTVINKIDTQISSAAKEYMGENSKTWLSNFSQAKSEYARMKQLQDNALFRMINRPGMTEEGIQRAISKYGMDKDVDTEVFNSVIERVSPQTRSMVEGSAIKNLVNKHTSGSSAEFQATNFAQLADDLKSLNITSPAAKNMLNVINEIAKVYRNDPALVGISGRSLVSRPTNLATSVEGKARMAALQYTWESIMKYMPTRGARNLALIHKTEQLLRNPLHAVTADELYRMMPTEAVPGMKSLVRDLQEQVALAGPKVQPQVMNMYKRSASGNMAVSDGALGKGVYLFDKVLNAPPGANIIKHPVELSKLATMDTISSLVGRTVNPSEVKSIAGIADKLYEAGYEGIRYGDKAMLFPKAIQRSDK